VSEESTPIALHRSLKKDKAMNKNVNDEDDDSMVVSKMDSSASLGSSRPTEKKKMDSSASLGSSRPTEKKKKKAGKGLREKIAASQTANLLKNKPSTLTNKQLLELRYIEC